MFPHLSEKENELLSIRLGYEVPKEETSDGFVPLMLFHGIFLIHEYNPDGNATEQELEQINSERFSVKNKQLTIEYIRPFILDGTLHMYVARTNGNEKTSYEQVVMTRKGLIDDLATGWLSCEDTLSSFLYSMAVVFSLEDRDKPFGNDKDNPNMISPLSPQKVLG